MFAKQNFFEFLYSNRELYRLLWRRGLQEPLHRAFCQTMLSGYDSDSSNLFAGYFYSYGLFGLLEAWVRHDFRETPGEMAENMRHIIVHGAETL